MKWYSVKITGRHNGQSVDVAYYLAVVASLYGVTFDGLFTHLAGKLAGGRGWVNPSNSTGLEADRE